MWLNTEPNKYNGQIALEGMFNVLHAVLLEIIPRHNHTSKAIEKSKNATFNSLLFEQKRWMPELEG